MKQNTLTEIAEKLLTAKRILLFPHMRVDGDALGSCVALCAFLRQKNKEAYVLIEDEIPKNLQFLAGDYCTMEAMPKGWAEICVSVDCSDPGRFEKRGEIFREGQCRICIDHHLTSEYFGDLNFIDSTAAATGEIIYDLIGTMGGSIDKEMGNALYAAITTDTGNFCYSNTTKKTHQIVAALYDSGMDNCGVCNEIYDSIRREQLTIHSMALAEMETFAGGQANLACINKAMLATSGAKMSETDGIVEKLRGIQGVEISALLKEEIPGVVKVSLRAKSYGNVAAVAQRFGGGGHKKAAGCTIQKPLEEAKREMKRAIEEQFNKERTC